jgi:group I intron endonuclease
VTDRKGWVYLIRCIPNGKVYAGSSVTPARRFYLHRRDLAMGKHHSPPLQASWDKYGVDAFTFEIVEEAAGLKALLAAEQAWIDKFIGNSMNCARVAGSPLGVLRTPEQKKRMREIKRIFYLTPEGQASLKAANLKKTGRVQSPEERAMRSAALKGKSAGPAWTDERRAKHSIALTGRKMPPVSDITRQRISAAKKGRPSGTKGSTARAESVQKWVAVELPHWLALKSEGKSYREIERITGRSRNVVARECTRAAQ